MSWWQKEKIVFVDRTPLPKYGKMVVGHEYGPIHSIELKFLHVVFSANLPLLGMYLKGDLIGRPRLYANDGSLIGSLYTEVRAHFDTSPGDTLTLDCQVSLHTINPEQPDRWVLKK
jgi:hypothetical protein